ncbi:hypothetical protein E3J61_02830 [Candidatus Dependentiae bacterium]|nr:MAG: hypothetical protein E3J61_02830 [Candidatus Dependentiae bacterium]
MNKKVLGLLVVVIVGAQSIQALTKKQVVARAAIVGLSAGTGMYIAYLPAGNGFLGRQLIWPLRKSTTEEGRLFDLPCGPQCTFREGAEAATVAGLGTVIGMSALSAWVFSHWTAKSRLTWAQKQYEQLVDQSLYRVQMNSANISRILQNSGCEYEDMPLVEAFLRLRSYDETLRDIEKELIAAINEVGIYSKLGRRLKSLSKRIGYDLNRVRANETFIKNHDKTAWIEQWKIHQKRELERERMRQQALAYAAPQIHGHVVYHWQ